MHLIRTLLVCLACLAAGLMPARASAACPMMQMQSAQMHAAAAHPRHHERSCPAPMTCCVPVAAHPAPPSVTPSRAATRRPPVLVLRERIGEDAARPRLLRPPTAA